MKRWFGTELLLVLFCNSLCAATITLDENGNGDATTFGDAMAMAFSNGEDDEIVINAGTYFTLDNDMNVAAFIGEDTITVRGADPANRPFLLIEPNFDTSLPETAIGDGLVIQMNGSLTLQDVIILPSENFFFDPDVDDLIAVVNHGSGGVASSLNLTLQNVLIANSYINNEPVTLDGWDDPRFADTLIRDDAINIDGYSTDGVSDDTMNIVLDNVIITAYGTDVTSDGIVIDGPNIDCTIKAGTRLTYPRRNGINAFNYHSMAIEGNEENPVIVYGASTLPVRLRTGTNTWNHLWQIGLIEEDGTVTTLWAGRLDAAEGGGELVASHCIFSNAQNDGLFFNFDSETPVEFSIQDCTFFNVPALLRLGFLDVDPVPSSNVTFNITDCIIDNLEWPANNDGVYFPPEPTVIDYGFGDQIGANVNITNIAYRTETFVSSRSESRTPNTAGNIIADAQFDFQTTGFNPDRMNDFLVPANAELLAGKASGGRALDGARRSNFATSVSHWSIF